MLAALTALVVLGGIRRIAEVTQFLVPFMCLLYLGSGLVILLWVIQVLSPAEDLSPLPAQVGLGTLGAVYTGGLLVVLGTRYGSTNGTIVRYALSAPGRWAGKKYDSRPGVRAPIR